MSTIRIFFPESLSLNFNSYLEKPQSHYLTNVMRAKIAQRRITAIGVLSDGEL